MDPLWRSRRLRKEPTRCDLFMEEATEAPDLVGRFGCLDPGGDERFATFVCKDVQARQWVLEEREPLGGDLRAVPPDIAQVGEDLLRGCTVHVPPERRLVGRGLQPVAQAVQSDGPFRDVAGRRRIGACVSGWCRMIASTVRHMILRSVQSDQFSM